MTSTQPTIEPRVIAPFFNEYRRGNAVDTNTFKTAMLIAAEKTALLIFHWTQNQWIYKGQIIQVDQRLLIEAENLLREVRGGFSSIEDVITLFDRPKENQAALGQWMGQDLCLLLLRDLVESGITSTYRREHHNQLMHAIEDAVELLSQTFLWGNVIVDFPESLKGQALARLLANWAPFVRRPAIINFRGTIAWEQRMAYDAAARRCEDELMEHGFQGSILFCIADAFVVISANSQWRSDFYAAAHDPRWDDASPFRGTFVDRIIYDRFQEILAEELMRPIEYTPKV